MGDCNGYNSRCGFSTDYSSEEAVKKQIRYAKILMEEREVGEPFKGRMKISDILINTTIPQIFGDFIGKKDVEACALGAIHLEAGGHRKACKPDWNLIRSKYDCYNEELDQRVKCTKCKKVNSLSAMIFHMNDVHELTNKQIGKWLKRYNL